MNNKSITVTMQVGTIAPLEDDETAPVDTCQLCGCQSVLTTTLAMYLDARYLDMLKVCAECGAKFQPDAAPE